MIILVIHSRERNKLGLYTGETYSVHFNSTLTEYFFCSKEVTVVADFKETVQSVLSIPLSYLPIGYKVHVIITFDVQDSLSVPRGY